MRVLILAGLCIAVLLAALMAGISEFDRHPDEFHHLAAAVYYKDHWLPPVIGDPSVRDSYSVWGVSYLNYHFVEYFLAGKFALLVSPFIQDPRLGVRFFNVFLLAALAAFFIYRSLSDASVLVLSGFLLVTPQLWYVFSYSNNDGFAVFVSMLLAYHIAYPGSALSRLLDRHDDATPRLYGALVGGALTGLLFICKPNYWVFIAFSAAWLLIARPVNLRAFRRYALIVLIAAFVFSIRIGLDLYVNGETNFAGASYINYLVGGFEKKPGKLYAYQEEVAAPEFKPSTIDRNLDATAPSVKLKAKGVTVSEMFNTWSWHRSSFDSFVGVYGYMNIRGPSFYYYLMIALFAGFTGYVFLRTLLARDKRALIRTALAFTAAGISIFISFYLSWNYAFQAQGRYLFPIIPMFAMLTYSVRDALNRHIFVSFILLTFLLSIYSFIFVGLINVT